MHTQSGLCVISSASSPLQPGSAGAAQRHAVLQAVEAGVLGPVTAHLAGPAAPRKVGGGALDANESVIFISFSFVCCVQRWYPHTHMYCIHLYTFTDIRMHIHTLYMHTFTYNQMCTHLDSQPPRSQFTKTYFLTMCLCVSQLHTSSALS